MLPAPGPRLPRLLEALAKRGVRGVLLSGGWRKDGTLPVEPYIDTLVDAKRRLRLVFNIHLGLVTDHDLLLRVAEFADIVDYEFTLSDWMVRQVRGLPFGPQRYLEAMDAMLDAGLNVVPHIFLWHPRQTVEQLEQELREVADRGIKVANLLVYIPPKGDIDPRVAEKLPHLAEHVYTVFPGKLYLGCMRPRAARRILDSYVIEHGIVERIANPSLEATRRHKERLVFYDACCSIPEDYLEMFRVDTP
jgi:uncharacterized radical SAM superfamily protein